MGFAGDFLATVFFFAGLFAFEAGFLAGLFFLAGDLAFEAGFAALGDLRAVRLAWTPSTRRRSPT